MRLGLSRRWTTSTLPRSCIINFYQLSYFLNNQPFWIRKRFLINYSLWFTGRYPIESISRRGPSVVMDHIKAPVILVFFSNKFLSTFALCWFDAPSSEKDNPSTPGMIRKPAPDLLASQIPYFSHSAWTLLSALHACNIWESAFWTTSDGMSFSSVKGHWPPLARVAAIIAAASGVIAVLNESNELFIFLTFHRWIMLSPADSRNTIFIIRLYLVAAGWTDATSGC